MFQSVLDLVVERYGIMYWHNPEFVGSEDRARLIRLAELAVDESRSEIGFDPEDKGIFDLN